MGKRGRALKDGVRRDPDLVDDFREACRLFVELRMTSRLRWRKRRRLEAELTAACNKADARVAELKRPGATQTPLRRILEDRGADQARKDLDGLRLGPHSTHAISEG